MTDSARDKARRNRRVAKAVRKPRVALDAGWHEDPAFCKAFFDQCEDAALFIAPGTLDLVLRAVELAEARSARGTYRAGVTPRYSVEDSRPGHQNRHSR